MPSPTCVPPSNAADLEELRAALEASGREHRIVVHPGAGPRLLRRLPPQLARGAGPRGVGRVPALPGAAEDLLGLAPRQPLTVGGGADGVVPLPWKGVGGDIDRRHVGGGDGPTLPHQALRPPAPSPPRRRPSACPTGPRPRSRHHRPPAHRLRRHPSWSRRLKLVTTSRDPDTRKV